MLITSLSHRSHFPFDCCQPPTTFAQHGFNRPRTTFNFVVAFYGAIFSCRDILPPGQSSSTPDSFTRTQSRASSFARPSRLLTWSISSSTTPRSTAPYRTTLCSQTPMPSDCTFNTTKVSLSWPESLYVSNAPADSFSSYQALRATRAAIVSIRQCISHLTPQIS